MRAGRLILVACLALAVLTAAGALERPLPAPATSPEAAPVAAAEPDATVVPSGSSWTAHVREKMIADALKVAPPVLARMILRHPEALREGLARAAASEGSPEHRQEGDDARSGAAASLGTVTRRAVAALDGHNPMSDVVFHLGVLAHLAADLNDPFLAAPAARASTFAPDFAAYLERNARRFPVVFYGHEPPAEPPADRPGAEAEGTDPPPGALPASAEGGAAAADPRIPGASFGPGGDTAPPDPADSMASAFEERGIEQAALDSARRARGYFSHLDRAYAAARGSSATFDVRSIPFGIASICYSRAVTDIARAWVRVWREARGDLAGTPYLPDAPPIVFHGPSRTPAGSWTPGSALDGSGGAAAGSEISGVSPEVREWDPVGEGGDAAPGAFPDTGARAGPGAGAGPQPAGGAGKPSAAGAPVGSPDSPGDATVSAPDDPNGAVITKTIYGKSRKRHSKGGAVDPNAPAPADPNAQEKSDASKD